MIEHYGHAYTLACYLHQSSDMRILFHSSYTCILVLLLMYDIVGLGPAAMPGGLCYWHVSCPCSTWVIHADPCIDIIGMWVVRVARELSVRIHVFILLAHELSVQHVTYPCGFIYWYYWHVSCSCRTWVFRAGSIVSTWVVRASRELSVQCVELVFPWSFILFTCFFPLHAIILLSGVFWKNNARVHTNILLTKPYELGLNIILCWSNGTESLWIN